MTGYLVEQLNAEIEAKRREITRPVGWDDRRYFAAWYIKFLTQFGVTVNAPWLPYGIGGDPECLLDTIHKATLLVARARYGPYFSITSEHGLQAYTQACARVFTAPTRQEHEAELALLLLAARAGD